MAAPETRYAERCNPFVRQWRVLLMLRRKACGNVGTGQATCRRSGMRGPMREWPFGEPVPIHDLKETV